jgi:alpha-1,6-mannosyltransferase
LKFMALSRLRAAMRIVDVCAFYSPFGGGVRTYVDAKLRVASHFGHELIVIAPGEQNSVRRIGPGAVLATIASPTLPVDRKYRYFDDEAALHRLLDAWQPDHVEASSPWSSATMVGRWQGAATRSLVMHADPLAAYAYRWLGGLVPTPVIDRWFARFWSHLRGLDGMFDLVVCANDSLTARLRDGRVHGAETIRMGVEPGLFSPRLRNLELRTNILESLGLDSSAVLLIGVGRLAGEKRWDMVVRAAGECARGRRIGLLLVGEGPKRRKLLQLADRLGHVALVPGVADRAELARLLASADALVHGCEAETFSMVAAEARASGIPLIVPDRGAAADHLVPGAGFAYRAACQRSLESAIHGFVDRGPELQRALAARHSEVRTINEHFEELFSRYAMLDERRTSAPQVEQPQARPMAAGEAPALR